MINERTMIAAYDGATNVFYRESVAQGGSTAPADGGRFRKPPVEDGRRFQAQTGSGCRESQFWLDVKGGWVGEPRADIGASVGGHKGTTIQWQFPPM